MTMKPVTQMIPRQVPQQVMSMRAVEEDVMTMVPETYMEKVTVPVPRMVPQEVETMVPQTTTEMVAVQVPRMIPQEVVTQVPEVYTEMQSVQVPRTQMREVIETVQPIVTQQVQYQTSVQYGGVTPAPQTYPMPTTSYPSMPMTTGMPMT